MYIILLFKTIIKLKSSDFMLEFIKHPDFLKNISDISEVKSQRVITKDKKSK